jgi:hypothetical protein
MDTTLAAAASQYPHGWGGIVAILIPFLLLWAATTGYGRWKELRQEGSSPSEDQKSLGAVKPQISGDSGSDDSTPGSGGGAVVQLRSREIQEYVAARVDRQASKALVRDVTKRFKVSESTAWRAINKARDARNGGAA